MAKNYIHINGKLKNNPTSAQKLALIGSLKLSSEKSLRNVFPTLLRAMSCQKKGSLSNIGALFDQNETNLL